MLSTEPLINIMAYLDPGTGSMILASYRRAGRSRFCHKNVLVQYQVSARVRTLNSANYKRIVLDYPDIPFENREEPSLHRYRTYLNEDRVVIHQRK